MNKIHWHPAFCGATEWELRGNKQNLSFETEHTLSKEPLRMDLLIIRKDPAAVIQNEIGKIFRTFNIVEFKGSGDSLTIDDYYKTVGYACLYKGFGKHVNEIPSEEITLTLMREAYPRELFKTLEGSGVKISEKYQGIYYLSGNITFDTQILVTKELDGEKHASLKILSRKAQESDVRTFLQEAKLVSEPGDRHNVSAVLQVSVYENRELYWEVSRRNQDMCCEALRELMKDDLIEASTKSKTEANLECIRNLMKNMKLSAKQAMETLEIPKADRKKYAAML